MIRSVQLGGLRSTRSYSQRSLLPLALRKTLLGGSLPFMRPATLLPPYGGINGNFSRCLAARHTVRNYSTPIGKIEKPTYQLSFTCKACQHRSSHLVSKQAYHNGTVLIQCPSCLNRHLIADHLNVFGQGKKTLEDILREKGDGEIVKKKTVDLSKIGDIEWEGPNAQPEQTDIKQID